MDSTEGEWGIFEDCWARYKRMTGLTDAEGVRDELRESCMKQLITCLVQMQNTGTLGSSNNAQLLRFIEAIKDEILVLCQEILKPYLSKESINSFVGDLLSTVTGNRDQLYSSILDYNDIVKRIVSSLILSYSREKEVTYQDTRKGGRKRLDSRGLTETVISTWTKAHTLRGIHVPRSALSWLVSRCLNKVSQP